MAVWDLFAQRGVEVRFGVGDVLMHHGVDEHHCYAIAEGEVIVETASSQGARVVLAVCGPGSVMGELGVLGDAPRSATVRARTRVVATRLGSDELLELLRLHPELAIAELQRISGRLRDLTERYTLRGEEVQTRVENLLRTHLAETGDPVFRSTREELACWIGATREAVCRSLRALEREDRVALRRGEVELLV